MTLLKEILLVTTLLAIAIVFGYGVSQTFSKLMLLVN